MSELVQLMAHSAQDPVSNVVLQVSRRLITTRCCYLENETNFQINGLKEGLKM